MPTISTRSKLVISASALCVGLATVSQSAAEARPRPTPTTTTVAPTTTVASSPVLPVTGLRIRQVADSGPTTASVIWNPSPQFVFYTVFLNGIRDDRATCSGGPYCFGDDAISATFRGLTPGTTYRVVVVANRYVAFGGGSAPSTEFVFTTPTA